MGNMGQCRLCKNIGLLKNSHFIPNAIIKDAKREASCSQVHRSDKKGIFQDGLKEYFLCQECESLFGTYEKKFIETIYSKLKTQNVIDYDNQRTKYFILSVAWRYMQYRLERKQEKLSYFYDDLKNLKNLPYYRNRLDDADKDIKNEASIVDNLRTLLLGERHKEIEAIQMHMIPTQRIIQFQSLKAFQSAMGLNFFKTSKYECVSIQIPRLMLLCTINGSNQSLSKFEVGNPIGRVVDAADLPHDFFDILLSGAKLIQKAKEIN